MRNKDTFNDRMVRKTVIPAIYLWLLASGAVVAMGIFQTDIVLANLEQTSETSEMPIQAEHGRLRDIAEHEHQMHMEKELKVPWGEEVVVNKND